MGGGGGGGGAAAPPARTPMALYTTVSISFYIVFTSVPQRKDIVNVTLRNCRFYDTLANNLCFNVAHKNVCKSNGHFCAHGCTMDLEVHVVPSIELEGIFFENECWHFSQVYGAVY